MAGRLIRRGQAEVLASLLVIAVVILILTYLWVFGSRASTMGGSYLVTRASYLMSKGCENLLISSNFSNVIKVINVGSVESSITWIVLNTSSGIELAPQSTCVVGSIKLEPGQSTFVECSAGNPIGVVTRLGNVFLVNPQLVVPPIATRINLTPLTVNITSVSNLSTFLYNPSVLESSSRAVLVGISSGDYVSSVGIYNYTSATNAQVSISLTSAVAVFIGSDLAKPGSYNIMIVGIGAPFGNQISINGKGYDLSHVTVYPKVYDVYAYRIILEGFTGQISGFVSSLKPGVYVTPLTTSDYLLSIPGVGAPLQLQGYADRVQVYVYTSDAIASHYTGYAPFVMVGDVDGDGYSDIVLDTWSLTVGDLYSLDDAYSGEADLLVESLEPIAIVFRNAPINASKYQGVVLAVKLWFWDDSLNGTIENPNSVIVRLGLVELTPSGLQWVTWKDFSYNELVRYRAITQISSNPPEYVFGYTPLVREAYFVIPPQYRSQGAVLYPAIAIEDPFGLSASGSELASDSNVVVDVGYVGMSLVG